MDGRLLRLRRQFDSTVEGGAGVDTAVKLHLDMTRVAVLGAADAGRKSASRIESDELQERRGPTGRGCAGAFSSLILYLDTRLTKSKRRLVLAGEE